MLSLRFVKDYISHYLKSGNAHHIHSPFLYDWYTYICTPQAYYCFDEIEKLRENCLKNPEILNVTDWGAAKSHGTTYPKKISAIAANSLKSKFLAQKLFLMLKYQGGANVLELGTSLGITTSYFASVGSNVNVHTLEGCPNTLQVAQRNFDTLGLKNIKSFQGNFNQTLPEVLQSHTKWDYIFLDGNHAYEPTLSYLESLLPHTHDDTIIILDDIYWSEGMKKAWHDAQHLAKVTVSVDFFWIGVLFLQPKLSKQQFQLKFNGSFVEQI